VAETRYYAAPPDSPARAAAQRDIHRRLAELLEQRLGPQRLAIVGSHALADAEP